MKYRNTSFASAEQRCQIAHQAQVGLDGATLAFNSGLRDLQVGEGLRLHRELVGKAVALGLSALVLRSAELGGCRKCCLRVDGRRCS